MASLLGQFVRKFILIASVLLVAACATGPTGAAPFAAIVIDARTGQVLYEKNADARLHPASLTKMLTLYIVFDAIERGEISLDSMVTISKNAASEPPSRLGLRAGQKVALRNLIRAAAVKSANDAATAIGEALEGSEAAFAARMNRTAKALGMTSSTFKSANGLTREGHLSTARDMTTMGRRLFYDFPQYYNIFSRRSTDAGLADVNNTNRRFLDAYKGADGIKTGYTVAAGFNLTASAERGGVRLIATVFGGTSTAQRNAKVAELLDLGFSKAPRNAPTRVTPAPNIAPEAIEDAPLVAENGVDGNQGAGKTIRLNTVVAASLRPKTRPAGSSDADAAADAVFAMQDDIAGALAEATGAEVEVATELAAEDTPLNEPTSVIEVPVVVAAAAAPAAPEQVAVAEESLPFAFISTEDEANIVALSGSTAVSPPPKPAAIIHTSTSDLAEADVRPTDPEVVVRISTSGGRQWGINIGRYNSHGVAERALMKTMLTESSTLGEGLRKIVQKSGGFDANFMGLTQDQADLACRRLQARGTQCFAIGP